MESKEEYIRRREKKTGTTLKERGKAADNEKQKGTERKT